MDMDKKRKKCRINFKHFKLTMTFVDDRKKTPD